jgi:RHS repeat-associated protein
MGTGSDSDLARDRRAVDRRGRVGALRLLLGALVLTGALVVSSSAPPVFASTSVSGTINVNTTWNTAGSPYLLSGAVSVASAKTLTVDAGVVVKFQSGAALTVNGTIDVNGSSGSPVIFTSIKDDAADGNDSGGDGATTPQPGDWASLSISGTGSTFDWANLRYGGSGSSKLNGMLTLSKATTLTDSIVTKSNVSGIKVEGGLTGANGSATLLRTKVSENGYSSAGAVHGDGIYANNANVSIDDSALWQNAENGLEFSWVSGYAASPSSITDTSIWMNGLKDGTSSSFGVSMNTSNLPSGKAPDGSGNNIYDNGNFLPNEDWLQLNESHSITGWRSDADWSGNFWGAYDADACAHTPSSGNTDNHISYDVPEPSSSTPVYSRGPVSTETDGTGGCLHDDVDADPAVDSMLDLQFDAPPPVAGGMPLEQGFGCLCGSPDAVAQSNNPPAITPAARAGGVTVPHRLDPVNMTSGTLTETYTDISLPGPGIPFQVVRTYNSRDTTAGIMGPGWTIDLASSLAIDGSGNVTYESGDGQQVAFTKNGTNYIARTDLVLKKVSTTYTMTTPDQRVFTYDSTGKLTQAKSRFGPATTFSYTGSDLTGVTDSAGRAITLTYSSSKLTKIQLPDGRHVDYSYTSGKLVGFADMRAKSWVYHYDANGYLDQITDPLGHYPLRATYDANGRATSTKDGEGNQTDIAYSTSDGYQVVTTSIPGGGDWIYKSVDNLLFSQEDPLHRVTTYRYDAEFRPVAIADGRGKTRKFAYDSRGNLKKETAPAPLSYTQTWTYNATNDVLTNVDWRGHTTTNAYYNSSNSDHQTGQLQTVTDPESGVTTYTYYTSGTKQGQVHTIVNARSKTTTLDYDADGNLDSITSPMSNETTMTYDSSGRKETLVDPRGNLFGATVADYETTWTYDNDDNVLSVVNPRGEEIDYHYDDAGRRDTMTTPDGVTNYTYDTADRLTHTEDPRSGDEERAYTEDGRLAALTTPEGSVTTYFYDDAGQLETLVEPRGNAGGATPSDYTWTYTYDDAGNLLTKEHPDAGETDYTYDAINRVTEIEDPLHHLTDYTYDENDNTTRVTDDLANHDDYTYDDNNQMLTATDKRGKQTSYTYFATGELATVKTPLNEETDYTLDNDGRVSTMTTPEGVATTPTPAHDYEWDYGYDDAGNLTDVTDPEGNHTETVYDGINDPTSVTDARTNQTTYTYDDMNRLHTVTTPGSPAATTTYDYDAQGNLETRTDPKTHTTDWTYDLDGQAETMTTQVGEWDYTYDLAGNLDTMTTPAGTATGTVGDGVVSYDYDRMNRLTDVDYSDATPDVVYQYDDAGNRTQMTDGIGTETYQYDELNRLEEVARGTDTFQYAYADGLNLTSRTYPDGTSIAATYTNDEQLHDLTVSSQTTTFGYDANGNLHTTAYPSGNGYTETRSYDEADRLTEVANTASGPTILSDFAQTLDPNGNPTLIATNRGGSTTNVTYDYDERNRLLKACYGVTSCGGASNYFGYTYDKNSNITDIDRVGSVPNPAAWDLTYNSADQLTSRTDGTNTVNYTYDDNGNLASAGSRSYTYDLANHQTQTALSGVTSTYTYDGDGKRITSSTSGGGANLRFWWDINDSLPMLAQENDGGGSLVRRWINGAQGALSMSGGGNLYYLHRDPIGSITDVTNSSGTAQWQTTFEPYGDVKSQSHPGAGPAVPLGFAGQYMDSETSDYQMRARQYDPTVGLFESIDPAPAPLTESYTGSYSYAGGMPLVWTDPTGRGITDTIGEAVSGTAGLLGGAGASIVHHDVTYATALYNAGVATYHADKKDLLLGILSTADALTFAGATVAIAGTCVTTDLATGFLATTVLVVPCVVGTGTAGTATGLAGYAAYRDFRRAYRDEEESRSCPAQ